MCIRDSVTRWNSEKLDGINKRRLIRVVNQAIEAFGTAAGEGTTISNTTGYGNGLTLENCTVLNPKHDSDERGIVAEISPLTFYCPSCHKVYQFKDSEVYQKYKKCCSCHAESVSYTHLYKCRMLNGLLKLKEHEAAKWVSQNELKEVDWLAADRIVVERMGERQELL